MVAAGRGVGAAGRRAGPLARRRRCPTGDVDRAGVDGLRFTLAFRGYRMDEVDDVLDRLVDELESRDARIAELEGGHGRSTAPAARRAPGPGGLTGGRAGRHPGGRRARRSRSGTLLTDWDEHDRWMLLTRAEGGRAVGGEHRGVHRRRAGSASSTR